MKILYFAWVREKTGIANEKIALPDDIGTVLNLINWLSARGDGYAEAFSNLATVRVAINQEYAGHDQAISNDDEIAFFPPITGG